MPVLSEEGNVPWQERKKWQSFWLVDPLDGTREFISKNGQFTINVALVEEHTPHFWYPLLSSNEGFLLWRQRQGCLQKG